MLSKQAKFYRSCMLHIAFAHEELVLPSERQDSLPLAGRGRAGGVQKSGHQPSKCYGYIIGAAAIWGFMTGAAVATNYAQPAQTFLPQAPIAAQANTFIPQSNILPRREFSPNPQTVQPVRTVQPAPNAELPVELYPNPETVPAAQEVPQALTVQPTREFYPQPNTVPPATEFYP